MSGICDVLDDALAYAAQGLHVHPVHNLRTDGSCTCGKGDCEHPGKHPWSPHGKDDATTDPATICELWRGKPTAQVAVNCGASGIVTLDTDVHGDTDGRPAWAALVAEHPALEAAPMAETPGDGWHAFYRLNGDRIGKPGGAPLGAGIDVIGEGGYVILPSAASPARDWVPGRELGSLPTPPLPRALAERLTFTAKGTRQRKRGVKRDAAPAAAGQEEAEARVIPEGNRNDTLFRDACAMRAREMSRVATTAALLEDRSGLSASEVERIIASAWEYVPGHDSGEGDAPADSGTGEGESAPALKWLSGPELAALTPEEPDYVLRPYIGRGLIVQLAGKVKGGKSTLAMHIAAAVLRGRGFLEES